MEGPWNTHGVFSGVVFLETFKCGGGVAIVKLLALPTAWGHLAAKQMKAYLYTLVFFVSLVFLEM